MIATILMNDSYHIDDCEGFLMIDNISVAMLIDDDKQVNTK